MRCRPILYISRDHSACQYVVACFPGGSPSIRNWQRHIEPHPVSMISMSTSCMIYHLSGISWLHFPIILLGQLDAVLCSWTTQSAGGQVLYSFKTAMHKHAEYFGKTYRSWSTVIVFTNSYPYYMVCHVRPLVPLVFLFIQTIPGKHNVFLGWDMRQSPTVYT